MTDATLPAKSGIDWKETGYWAALFAVLGPPIGAILPLIALLVVGTRTAGWLGALMVLIPALPVAYLCNVDYVLTVAANSPYKTLQDLLDAAGKKPGAVSYMSTGQRGPLHVAMEYLSKRAGVSMVHVPYKGESPALPDLMSGRIDVAVMTVPFTKPRVADGSLRVLATISAQRAAAMPDVPTVAELGFDGYAVPIWNGFFVPRHTPDTVIDTLNRASRKILDDPAVRQRMIDLGVTPTGGTPADYASFLAKERKRWTLMIDETGVLNN